jgi:hypothetical protein
MRSNMHRPIKFNRDEVNGFYDTHRAMCNVFNQQCHDVRMNRVKLGRCAFCVEGEIITIDIMRTPYWSEYLTEDGIDYGVLFFRERKRSAFNASTLLGVACAGRLSDDENQPRSRTYGYTESTKASMTDAPFAGAAVFALDAKRTQRGLFTFYGVGF